MLAQFKVGEPGFQLIERLDWLPSLGISYLVGVDGISVLLVPMTTLLTFISVLYSSGGAIKTRITEYMTAFLLLEVGMVGVFPRARSLPLLHLLRADARADVLDHRDLGRPAAHLRDAQVRPLYSCRLAPDARGNRRGVHRIR